nr:RING-H2 finger protein ATL48-like [Ipomoea batatas]
MGTTNPELEALFADKKRVRNPLVPIEGDHTLIVATDFIQYNLDSNSSGPPQNIRSWIKFVSLRGSILKCIV